MNLLGSFAARAPNKVFVSIILGALAGMSYSLIIPLVLSVLDPDKGRFSPVESEIGVFLSWQISNYRSALLFAGVCLFILVARTTSQVILARVSMDVTTDLRTTMYRRIASAPVSDLERIGMAKLVASITADVPVIIAGARLLPDLLTNAVTLVGMLGFLLYLNADVFWFVMKCIGLGIVTYQIPMLAGRRYLTRARRRLDDLHESIRGLVHGAKELKLNHDKREDYFRHVLAENESNVCEAGKTGHTIMRVAMNYGSLITFFVIGAVSFVFVNHHAIARQELNGVIMALLYVTGPVGALLNFIPQFTTAQIALKKVNQLFGELPRESVRQEGPARRDWSVMRFRGVRYRYPSRNGETGFSVGPLDLEIRKGEITFIVGGNGSGKSTLSKLVTLHYHASEGSIHFDGQAVDDDTMAGYRRGIASIYSDYYLFDRALGIGGRDVQGFVDQCLRDLGLDQKVSFSEGRFSTLALSDGQKRRLALVVAFLEDAELYLFDEWAADQDPSFKIVFYTKILPTLKAAGKAVVAITHDDRYFHLADRLVVMNEGRIERIETPAVRCVPEAIAALTD
jgi:putative ATP-binding cassette transporter